LQIVTFIKKCNFARMNSVAILEIKKLLLKPRKIVIVPHRNPDGDAMGSTLALWHLLKKLHHSAVIIAPNEFPDFLAWMPGADEICVFERETKTATQLLQEADLVFTLDFNALHRTGDLMETVLSQLTCPFAMIDHHQSPDVYATFMYSDTSMGSTCQMVFHFVEFLEMHSLLDKTIATCMYTGIVTDSGSFRYASTTSQTHRVVAHLLDLGVENNRVHNQLFDNSTFSRLQLLGKALQNMTVMPEFQTSFITLSQAELDEFQYKKGETEGIVNYGLSIKDVIFTAIFIENKQEGIIKISFRSQDSFDVNQFARTYFQGGGHINAAGGKSLLSLQETVERFKEIISEQKDLKK
jgi:phosphoesterase RecJ-like protein